jgi:hypothetical protein
MQPTVKCSQAWSLLAFDNQLCKEDFYKTQGLTACARITVEMSDTLFETQYIIVDPLGCMPSPDKT